jgi:Melibiase
MIQIRRIQRSAQERDGAQELVAAIRSRRGDITSLSLDLGVRADFSRGSLPAQSSPGGAFAPARTFAALSDVIAWNSLSPRAGIAWTVPYAHGLVLRGAYFRLSEDYLLEELQFARRMGFDVFYHDASWYEGSSLVPGTNDWSSGLGSYRESPEKFPSGLKHLSEAVRKAGMKFGIWVDPGNVDSERVAKGEFPDSWLAKIDGAPLVSRHPSLAPMTQLCLGNPDVVAFVKQNLGRIIDQWNLEWIKWDPSGTVNNNCNRTDHGHARNNGAYSAWKGKLEVWSYLMERYPQLSGFECDPSLRYARSNPATKSVLPGGYITEFITGPMVSPYVWGSPYSAKSELGMKWYSASALDYDIRKHLVHGFVFGNIDGMLSQRLSAAPQGYLEAFQRNLLFFKRYRHLLTEDVYHPALSVGASWSAIQYIKEDGSESVVFVFRDGGAEAINRVKPSPAPRRRLRSRVRRRLCPWLDRPPPRCPPPLRPVWLASAPSGTLWRRVRRIARRCAD